MRRRGRWILAGTAVLGVAAAGLLVAPVGGSGGASSAFDASPPRAVAPEFNGEPVPAAPPGFRSVDRAVVRTAEVRLEVADVAAVARNVRSAATAAGGFVADDHTDDDGAMLTLRVPADQLDPLVERVGTMGRLLMSSSTAQDVTEQSIDLEARVTSQQASVARVRSLLARAETIGEVVAVESELARREAELESLQRRLAALRDQVQLSTLDVDLRAAPGPGARPGFGAGLGAGWDGLRTLGAGLAAAIGFLLPFLPVLAVLAGLGWFGWRRVRNR
ncbi:DUF4349 domain-containing protein [Pseudonocardia asaccharolytica]|uniref:DUF4349 domain-containing protein n=1 Tax=Pseudonocardia asaccharolytica DSM 44247 = NBRC 16224 TaxID=1123024 RepID=A0A511CWR4_9PSEU|nr:DUF4349 domain-containing protein [Pseudonocardia asaccharolytica]GEL17010.1 hypothetical protein PA7_08470 [Pseudonocardia asaccharolytica DSM 44247 = NBRC 16224]